MLEHSGLWILTAWVRLTSRVSGKPCKSWQAGFAHISKAGIQMKGRVQRAEEEVVFWLVSGREKQQYHHPGLVSSDPSLPLHHTGLVWRGPDHMACHYRLRGRWRQRDSAPDVVCLHQGTQRASKWVTWPAGQARTDASVSKPSELLISPGLPPAPSNSPVPESEEAGQLEAA
jgi:hypothetical protein